jgi:signal recognition particle subunit SEC65
MENKDIDILKETLQGPIGDNFDITTIELYNRYKDKCDKYGVYVSAYPIFIDLVRNFKVGKTTLTINEKELIEIRKFRTERLNESCHKEVCCPHGFKDKSCCAECNGLAQEKRDYQKKYKDEIEARRQLGLKKDALQKETVETAVNHNKLWTDEELSYVIVNTAGFNRNDVDVIYRIATHLKRRFYAIEFILIKAWEEDKRVMFETEENLIERIDAIKQKLGE